MVLNTAAPVRAGFARMFVPLDLTPALPHLDVPTVLIAGDQDRLLPAWHSRELADMLPRVVEYAELAGVGHVAPLEAPEEVTGRIRRLAYQHLTTGQTADIAG